MKRQPGWSAGEHATEADPAIINPHGCAERGCIFGYEDIVKEKILENTFAIMNTAGEWIFAYPFVTFTTYSADGADSTILFASAADAKLFDPNEDDSLSSWNQEISYFDIANGETQTVTGASAVVKAESLTTATIALDGAFNVAPTDAADYIMPGGALDNADIQDFAFFFEGVYFPIAPTGDITAVGFGAGAIIDYDKLPTHSQNFVDAIMAYDGVTRAMFLSIFKIINRTA